MQKQPLRTLTKGVKRMEKCQGHRDMWMYVQKSWECGRPACLLYTVTWEVVYYIQINKKAGFRLIAAKETDSLYDTQLNKELGLASLSRKGLCREVVFCP